MVRVVMGKKGSGKTKKMIDLITEAVKDEKGDIVCIATGSELTYAVPHSIRLVSANDYDIKGFDGLKGFVGGLCAGNYDITHIFIEGLLKIVPVEVGPEVSEFLNWLNAFSEKNNIKFTVSISADAALAGEDITKYF